MPVAMLSGTFERRIALKRRSWWRGFGDQHRGQIVRQRFDVFLRRAFERSTENGRGSLR